MGYWEIELYKEVTKIQLGADIGYFTQNWKRYLDDCLIIWPDLSQNLFCCTICEDCKKE